MRWPLAASKIVELFGYVPADTSPPAKNARTHCLCPFVGDGTAPCTKEIGDRSNRIMSGVCSICDKDGQPVLVCLIRMYANQYRLLKDVATLAFKTDAIELPSKCKLHSAGQKAFPRRVLTKKLFAQRFPANGYTAKDGKWIHLQQQQLKVIWLAHVNAT